MHDDILIKSRIKDYRVLFVEDFVILLQEYADQGAFFIIDSLILEIYGTRISSVVPQDRILVIKANERNKTINKCQEIIETLVEAKFRRNDRLIAIGGGVIQDITAFTASILYRGVDWTFFPTTLLSQADSCIGGKTSINLGDKKNIVGNFYPPADIFIDTTFLKSLAVDDIKSGIGEILHYYLYSASPLFDELLSDYELVIRNRNCLIKHIQESLKIKKSVIESDEFDRGERNKFNYGHTFGHALESLTDYAIKHGQAVTVGMDIANYLSLQQGIMDRRMFDWVHPLLMRNFPDYDWGHFDMETYIRFLSKDKKNIGSDLVCILPEGPGRLTKQRIMMDDVFRDTLQAYFNTMLLSNIHRQT
ncbi:MAG: AroB-related putative sugar phosphate phospholyase (cyclizing) [Pseudomonadota bacterium]